MKKVYIVHFVNELDNDIEVYSSMNQANKRKKELIKRDWYESVNVYEREIIYIY